MSTSAALKANVGRDPMPERQRPDGGIDRQCTRCGQFRPLSTYHRQRTCFRGRKAVCSFCLTGKMTHAGYTAKVREVPPLAPRLSVTPGRCSFCQSNGGFDRGKCVICGTPRVRQ